MSETIPDLRNVPKGRAYAELKGHSDAILEGIDDDIAAMSTIAALVDWFLSRRRPGPASPGRAVSGKPWLPRYCVWSRSLWDCGRRKENGDCSGRRKISRPHHVRCSITIRNRRPRSR
jgi:hypothetical protein